MIPGLHTIVRDIQNNLDIEKVQQTLKMLTSLSEQVWLEKNFPNEDTYADLNILVYQGSTELSALCRWSAEKILVINDIEKLTEHTIKQLLASHKKVGRLISVFSPGVNFEVHVNKSLLELIEVEPTRLFLDLHSLQQEQELNQEHCQEYWAIPSEFANGNGRQDGTKATGKDKHNALGMQLLDLIPPEQTNIYTGDKFDIKTYLVERIADFYPFPKTVSLILTNRCNLKCVHCPFHSPKYVPDRTTDFFEGHRELDLETVERIAKEAGYHGAGFHIGELEEPALHPHLTEIIRIAKRHNVQPVHITTNGLLLKPEFSEEIIRAGLDSISFSVDAATPETYKAIRGGNFNTLVSNVIEFIRLRNEYRPDLWVRVIIIMQESAINEWEQFYDFWSKQGVNSIGKYQLYEGKEDGRFEVNKDVKFYHRSERSPCFELWDQCFVYPEGEVSLCYITNVWIPRMDMSKLSVGNVKEKSLQEIWLSENYQKRRLANIDEKWSEVPYCGSCDMSASCYPQIEVVDQNTLMGHTENESWYYFRK